MKQSEVLAPTPIKYPVAYAGLKNNIPLLPTGTNNASITEGFPEMTMKPLKAGGLPPRGEDMNGLFYLTTDQKAFFQDGGYITFDTAVSMLIGGYPKGAILDYYNESTNYYTKVTSLIDDNTNNFVEDPALIDGINWQFVDFGTGANENLSNISSLALDRINQSKALITGNVANYEEELSQITQMSHSTFDRSKFTIVGSPIVTDDGIASGFSSGNYIQIQQVTFNDSFKLQILVNHPQDTINNTLFAIKDINNVVLRAYTNTNGTIDVVCNGVYGMLGTPPSLFDKNLIFEIEVTPTAFNFKLWADGVEQSVNNPTRAREYFNIFSNSNTFATDIGFLGTAWNGSIDLKQFSITVDGVEVFSGNKTGIDTIKPDDYTVAGTPAISADGVASGFSDSNYLTQNLSISNATDFELISPVFYNILSSNRETVIMTPLLGTLTHLGLWSYANDTNAIVIINQDDNGTRRELVRRAFAMTSGVGYQVKWVLKNGLWDMYYRTTENAEWIRLTTTSVTATDTVTINNLIIGRDLGTTNAYCRGSIDLNAFKIYVDGNLVYQPCLKIPYTESKTGSKIVDSIYRDRVWDMYEQFGYAPYYTLSDTDFTLPMGEIYGMIQKRARDIAHPIAQPFYRFSDEINEDEVRLEGAEVDKGLYLAIEQNLSAYCTAGSTSDKICLPDFRDRVPWGANTQGYIEAGLPNITGNFGVMQYSYLDATGAFAIDTYKDDTGYEGGGFRSANISLNASRSSSIYNNNVTTVQPPAFKVRWLARYK